MPTKEYLARFPFDNRFQPWFISAATEGIARYLAAEQISTNLYPPPPPEVIAPHIELTDVTGWSEEDKEILLAGDTDE